VYSTVIAGCTLVYENSRFDAARSERRMHELRTTIYNGAPPHFAMMCDLPAGDQPPCLDLLISGGSAFTKALHRRMAERWPGAAIANWYGLMESGTGQTLSWGEDIAREPESIGRPVWPTEVRVVDADRNDVDDGVEGELWLRAPAQMREYFRNPEQTAQRLHAGWLRTGDRARKDGSGLYHVVGRTEDRINRGGFKFYPAELESVLEQHEGVREAGVIAVPHPTLGEDVVAFVVIGAGGEVSEEDLKQHCRQRVAANKVPAQILFEETLPRSSYGKVVRRELAERYASRKEHDE
ncbi:MAG: long-chain acyl-CoA synthetase, partial [Thermoleophilaceae bacterium]|nr:long-chain acyl-CoA synthetase [Thermoleophilaceae bacterium]